MKEIDNKFKNTLAYNLIYVFRINDKAHEGSLKVGMATVKFDENPNIIYPNHQYLQSAAKNRIDQYTRTAGISYELLYTELAIDNNNKAFADHDVHRVLTNSGIKKVLLDTGANEWFKTDLQTVKNAIIATKQGKKSLFGSQITSNKNPIILRPNQKDAVERTIKQFKNNDRMLWNAKMRFGKTIAALEVVKEMNFKKTIIMTHRPVVDDGWFEDFNLVFCDTKMYKYGSKSSTHGDSIENLEKENINYVYFASIQDLRGSSAVGGNFDKNDIVFSIDWDLVIIDEAHEGTSTSLGEEVINHIVKSSENHTTKLLELSGTPFNLLNKFDSDQIYTWDYVMEQREKANWYVEHYGDPNPYEELPKMHIYTYALDNVLTGYKDVEDMAFNFKEFFRVWTDNPSIDRRIMPKDCKIGEFVHKEDVRAFLDLLCKDDKLSNYPYSNKEYREYFRHSLWMIPGVKEAKALGKMLNEHPVFGSDIFKIVNVAGEGDDYEEKHYQDAKKKVEDAITDHPEDTYTITLSCGRLTTGVSIKAWTAIFMLSGSSSVSAQNYLQTIFRAQTPAKIGNRVKEDCYVFDFAPDRTLNMVAQASELSTKPGKIDPDGKVQMGEFLNFCPVIGISGSSMETYSVDTMMQQLKRAHADRVVKNGFDDTNLYNDNLLKLTEIEIKEFNDLNDIIGSSKAQKKTTKIPVNDQGLTEEEWEKINESGNKHKNELTEEQKAALEKLKEAKKQRKKAIDILRSISIRIPMLVYGADIEFEKDVTLDNFLEIVDDISWKEFMPEGVTKEKFKQFSKYYDTDVFIAAGRKIRNIAKSADKLSPTERVKKIAGLFATFKNPDKETVLTPWRVVNMQMSNTLGGWCFYDKSFDKLNGKLTEPRFVSQGEVTINTLATTSSKILEINSKSGLYPLYVAYSLYKQYCLNCDNKKLDEIKEKELWRATLANNIYVVTRTKMATTITKRTLNGYENTNFNIITCENIIEDVQTNQDKLVNKILNSKTWRKEDVSMKFDAIVGNPPYQIETGGSGRQAKPTYNLFVELAKKLQPNYISLITPSRWFSGGMGLEKFRKEMMEDKHIKKIIDYPNVKEVFNTVDIAGGVNYFLWEKSYNGKCEFINNIGEKQFREERNLNEFSTLVRFNQAIPIIRKVFEIEHPKKTMEQTVSPQKPFDLPTSYKPKERGIPCYFIQKIGKKYADPKDVKDSNNLLNKWKLIVPRSPIAGQTDFTKPVGFYYDGNSNIAKPGECCTESFIVAGAFETEEEVLNFKSYLFTKTVRFLLLQAVVSQDVLRNKYCFVPALEKYDIHFTDEILRERWNITDDEWNYIDSRIHNYDKTK